MTPISPKKYCKTWERNMGIKQCSDSVLANITILIMIHVLLKVSDYVHAIHDNTQSMSKVMNTSLMIDDYLNSTKTA